MNTEQAILEGIELRRQQNAAREQARREAEANRVKQAETETAALCASVQAKISAAPIVPKSDTPDPRAAQARQLLEAADIPPRHRHRISPQENHGWHSAREKISARLGNGFLIPITGPQGTGKTQLGSAIIYAATDKLLTARYVLTMDFFIALKETFADGAKKSESGIIAEFVKPKLLVLDEMDERSASDWENRLLFHLINKRYNTLVDTLLISRQDEQTFLASLGLSIQSRIQETGASIVCDWPSFRDTISTATQTNKGTQ